jgi:hypothetical protein
VGNAGGEVFIFICDFWPVFGKMGITIECGNAKSMSREAQLFMYYI